MAELQFDAQGKQVTHADAAAFAATGASAKACLTLYNGAAVDWQISITFDPNTLIITGGSIKGTICDSPNWKVTSGSLAGGKLLIQATRTTGGSCAATVTIVGTFQSPPSYHGTYGFNGSSTQFQHTTLYCCGAC